MSLRAAPRVLAVPAAWRTRTNMYMTSAVRAAAVGGGAPSPPPDEPAQEAIDFAATRKLYHLHSRYDLLFALIILKLASLDGMVKIGIRVLEAAPILPVFFRLPINFFVKKTFFKQFCSGETIEESLDVLQRLQVAGVGACMDYSAEGGQGSETTFDARVRTFASTILVQRDAPNVTFACIKVSGLTHMGLLKRFTWLLRKSDEVLPMERYLDVSSSPLGMHDAQRLGQLMDRLHHLCGLAQKEGVRVLIDAEETWLQRAIDYVALELSIRYNTRENAMVYTTYQMYLKESLARMKRHMDFTAEHGVKLGAKLVRGAYLNAERERAELRGYADPTNATRDITHRMYDKGVEWALNNIDQVGLVVASHNVRSVESAIEEMKELGIPSNHPDVSFAQLLGMADNITLGLGAHGFRVCKYVPFGPMSAVMPYLTRRVVENNDILAGTNMERSLLWEELKRRMRGEGRIQYYGGDDRDEDVFAAAKEPTTEERAAKELTGK